MVQSIVGIAANDVANAGEKLHNMAIVYTPAGYVKAVQKVGGLPFVIPIGRPQDAKAYVDRIDKLILAGGQNVDPHYYGEEFTADPKASYRKRDEFELSLIEEAVKQHKPVFAVCRGMQLLNVAFGGSLHQELTESAVNHLQPISGKIPTHHLQTGKDSVLRTIYGKQTVVNSFHQQGIRQLGTGFTATAWSPEDHLIEGIENPRERMIGVQWHPDFAYDVLQQEEKMFAYVVNQL